MLKFTGVCGRDVFINPKTVAYINSENWNGSSVTKIKFTGGASLYVKEYSSVVCHGMMEGEA